MTRSVFPRTVLAALGLLVLAGPARAEDKWARHYRERVEAFRAENEALPKKRTHLVFVGDSITEGFPLDRFFPDLPVLNRGIVADRVGLHRQTGVLHRLPESVFDTNPAVVCLLIGVNDLTADRRPASTWIGGIAQIVTEVRRRCPKADVVLQTLLPVGRAYSRKDEIAPKILEMNELLRALAKRSRKVHLLDLYALYAEADGYLPDDLTNDGLHIKAAGYERWADALKAMRLSFPDPLPAPKLSRGDRGAAVTELQTALTALGYPVGAIDGVFGGATESALARFQRDHGVAPDGKVREDTLEALRRALKEAEAKKGDPAQGAPAGASQLRKGGEELGLTLSGGGPIRVVRADRGIVAFQYRAKMSICADGASHVTKDADEAARTPGMRHDPWYQPQTAMSFRGGQPVDADRVPYIVLPPPVYEATGAQKGELCEVVYKGKRCYAIYAEVGPKTKIGEGSMYLARQLGIDDDPRRGGISSEDVTYTVLVGSGRPRGIRNGGPPVTAEEIQRLGAEAFAEARRLGVLE